LSKSILRVGLLIAAVAVQFIPGIGQAVGAALLISAGAATAGIEIALVLAGSLLLGPSGPKGSLTNTAQGRLYATLVTTEPRKWWLGGPTAGGNDVRYQTYTGTKQEYYHQVIAHASHQVQSIDEIWIDNEKAWSKTGGVLGRYVGWLTVTTRELATSGNGIAIDSVWTSSCTLTGCAYTYLQYKLLDTTNSSNASPFQSGISGRLTFRGKGAPTYDPRLDSTVTGGSGSQRAGTQSTWAWSDTASRNPALQLLWFLLGWQINGKIALGMGLPPARIDLASFITAANHCDESVTLAAGGSEPRYRADGLISEGDDRSAVVQHLCQTMNATLRDSGGKIALQVISNDLATPVATFGLNDILGSEQYEQTQPLNSYFNIVRGRRVDPTDQALYQLTDFPQVVLSSPDGIDRIQTTDYPLVQSNSQAQRIAKLSLNRAQYQAKYTATFGSNAWAVSLGNVVQINHSGMNWTNKLMRVVAQSIAQSGQVKMTLLEESTDVYTWAAEDVAGTIGGTPTVVVPTSLPISAGITAAKTATTYSSTAPTSPNDGDLWVDTTAMPYLFKMYKSGAWQVTSNYVTGTQYITDGAGLGNTALWSGVTGAGKAADNATVGADLATNVTNKSLANLDSAANTKLAGVQAAADVTTQVVGPSSGAISYDTTGTTAGASVDLAYAIANSTGIITSGVTMSYKIVTGTLNGFTSASAAQTLTVTAGYGTLTVTSCATPTATLNITATVGGLSRTMLVTVSQNKAAPSATAPGTASQTTGFTQLITPWTTYAAISSVLTLTMPAGKTATSTTIALAPIWNPKNISAGTAQPSVGPWHVSVKLQRSPTGASTWTDIGAVQSSSPDPYIDGSSTPTTTNAGTIGGTIADTGLTAGTTYDYRCVGVVSTGTTAGNSGGINWAGGSASVYVSITT
jgi:hypothetical protein